MRIVIIGAGDVGSYLADRLSTEGQDVVVIENDERRAADLQDSLDALVVTGNGASRARLRDADAHLADLLIAVSDSDAVNALACHAAHELGVPRTVARIEDPDVRTGIEDVGVDVVIDPGETAAREVVDLVSQGGVSDVVEFADGRLTLLGDITRPGSPLLERPLADLRGRDEDPEWVVAGIVREGRAIPVRGDTTVRVNDHVLIMVATDDLPVARRLLGLDDQPVERVVVLGSTRVAELTAELLLEHRMDVAIVDHDPERCRALASRHPKALVVEGDPTDPAVLADLALSDTDAVAALSGWDDVNLTGCLVGKSLGADVAIARFHRLAYVGLLTGTGIDAAVSARLAAANAILRFVRRGRIRSVATFKDSQAEALDIEVEPGSRAAGCQLRELNLPANAVVGGVVRDEDVFVPRGTTAIRGGDRLIVFAPAEAIGVVEALCTT